MHFDQAHQMKCKCSQLEDDPFPLQPQPGQCLHPTMMFNDSSIINLGTT